MKKVNKLGLIIATIIASMPAWAEEAVTTAVTAGDSSKGWIAIGAGVCMALAAFAGATAQGRIGGATMEGVSRNPNAQGKMFISMILNLVFIETIILFSFVIAILLVQKI